jgi:hypothetical protein
MEWWGSPGSQTAAVVETSANLVWDDPTCSEWECPECELHAYAWIGYGLVCHGIQQPTKKALVLADHAAAEEVFSRQRN